ncbi:uncharacterized protein F4807DRAFT_469464 [Annulohypoxylon truncatum]|uniref:uncharacterized protein n=1 Tax=Annulohypoxylon truncatum TaxID=327061 RepID=UPI0020072657|nr:uncharacterized protein F4807DRAFT_469464 [Annulohypoxylon truncatum]KAI1207228.1 hypothetical protein F4807DRAFT_469464 [Annulohypoxylon truncatum]
MSLRPLPDPPSPEWAPIVESIRKQYNEGLPFFNRALLQRVALQIHLYENGMLTNKPYAIENIRGDLVSLDIDPDTESPVFKDVRCNHGDRKNGPYIYYRSIQSMLTHRDMKQFDAEKAFLPLVVMFPSAAGRCHAHHVHESRSTSADDLQASILPTTFYPSELTTIFNLDRRAWEQSEQYAYLKGQLEAHSDRLSQIDSVVALGCGSLAHGRARCQFATTQHALAFSLRKVLSRMHPENSRVRQSLRQARKKEPVDLVVRGVLQDPAYTEVDEAVLSDMGMEIYKDPFGFLEMNDNSFVVSIDVNTPAQQIIENLARPAAIIRMTHVEELNGENVAQCTDPSSSRVNKMLLEEYDLVKLRYHEHLRHICLYIKKQKPEGKAGSNRASGSSSTKN